MKQQLWDLKPTEKTEGAIDFFRPSVSAEWRVRIFNSMALLKEHTFKVIVSDTSEVIKFLERYSIAKVPDNIWIGVKVKDASERYKIQMLTKVPARRFVDFRPLVGPIEYLCLDNIDWAIVGGARDADLKEEWAEQVIIAANNAGVPLYFKNWGRVQNNPIFKECPPDLDPSDFCALVDPDNAMINDIYIRETPAEFLP